MSLSLCLTMESKQKLCHLIFCLTMEAKQHQIKDPAPSISMIKKRFIDFRYGRETTSDKERFGSLVGPEPETIGKIHK